MVYSHPDHRYGSIVSNGKSSSIVNLLLTIFVLNYEYKDIKFLTPPTTQFEVPPSEKIAGGFQQAGKKEGGWGEGIFARLPKKRSESVGISFKMSSDFFQQTPPNRKLQARGSRLASLGD